MSEVVGCNVQIRLGEVGDWYDPAKRDAPLCGARAVVRWGTRCLACEDGASVTEACGKHAEMFGPAVETICACGRVVEKSEGVRL